MYYNISNIYTRVHIYFTARLFISLVGSISLHCIGSICSRADTQRDTAELHRTAHLVFARDSCLTSNLAAQQTPAGPRTRVNGVWWKLRNNFAPLPQRRNMLIMTVLGWHNIITVF